MRTRFLNIDYFSLDHPLQSQETPAFLHLPLPRLPPTPPPSSVIEHHLRFDSFLGISFRTDTLLPIDSVLSKFLSDVLPHTIHVHFKDFDAAVPFPDQNRSYSFSALASENRVSQEEPEVVYEDNEVEDRSTSGSETDVECPKENTWPAPSDNNETACQIIVFETPELDVLLETACFPLENWMQMLSETPGTEYNLEMLKLEFSTHYPYEVLESVSLIEDITSEYLMEQNAYSLEKNISVQNLPRSSQSIFPILEVDEESLGILTCLTMIENVGSHFDDIRPQSFNEKCHSVIEGKEHLDSTNYNMMDFLSDDFLSKHSLVLPDMLPEKDFIIMLETENIGQNSALQGMIQADSALLANLVTFQEFVFLDEDLIQNLEVLFDSKELNNPERNGCLFEKMLLPFKSFNELIVSNEIALIDDTFKSLPVPVISDCGKITSLCLIIREMLSNLKTQLLSASDRIYLNWDLLDEDKCNCKIYHLYQSMWAKIDLSNKDFEEKSFDFERSVFDLVFSSDTIGGCDINQSEELQKLLSDCTVLLDEYSTGLASSKQLDEGFPKQGNQELLAERVAGRASLFFRSISETSNLDYFLDPQKATSIGICKFAVESTDANVNIQKVTSTDLKSSYVCTVQSKEWHTILHRIRLTDSIVALIKNFEKSYLTILQSETELKNSDVDYSKFLSLQKHKLMEHHGNGNNMAFIALCAIKQAAWYLCYYGLHPASLYVDKLCQSWDYLKSRLNFLLSLIKEESGKVGNKITSAHPALTAFEEILKSNNKQDGLKVLIVAEEVFWYSLKTLLLSMGLSFNVHSISYANQPYAYNTVECTDTEMKDLLISDCLIVSYKHISPSLPFNKFGLIVEYGGPYGSSRISDLSTNSIGLPHLHFLKVDLDDHTALCEGVEMPTCTEMENETHIIFYPKESMTNQKLERLLNFCPLEKNYDTRYSKAADGVDCFVPPPIPAVKSENEHQKIESFSGAVIIMNTQNVDKEMIVSRRSTYKVILAMERGGAQVVERDLDLPVDIIISSAICLVWYNNENLGKKTTFETEASSRLLFCIENIATNVLTLLSFSFQGCFLVFEGELSFLASVMEFSDGIYAAAASLGIDLQIFFSYSTELTNDIIVSCIKYATTLTRGLYLKMPDSVTLAESFLTKFPSINPLTAHAILSSGAKLCEFLEWSHEHKLNDLEKYQVPEEIIALFSVFCRYGELEDSQSIMTDCSSSVSSGPESDRGPFHQIDNERKRRNHIGIPQVVDGFLDSSNLPKSCNDGMSEDAGRSRDLTNTALSTDATTIRNPSKVSQPLCDSWNCEAPQIIDQPKRPCLCSKDKELTQNDILNTAMTWHSLGNSENLHEDTAGKVVDLTYNLLLDNNFPLTVNADSKDFPSLMTETERDQIRKNKIARLSFDQSGRSEANSSSNWRFFKDSQGEVDHYSEPDFMKDIFLPSSSGKLHEDITGEAVNLVDYPLLDTNFSHVLDSMDFPSLMTGTEKEQRRKNKITRRLSFDKGIQHEASSSNIWRSLKDARGSVDNCQEPHFGNDVFPLDVKHLEKTSEKGFTQEPMRNLQGLPFQEEMSHLGGTPLSRALQSSSPIKSSPWRIEFINKIKEKSKLRKKSISCGNSAPFGYSGSMSKVAKRSPSTIDLFKYHGNRTPGVIPEKKRQKQSVQSSNSAKNGKHSASILPTLTPNGKKARERHTLAGNESGCQTRLVWNDGTLGLTKKLRHQTQ